jgi:hypothetical protein
MSRIRWRVCNGASVQYWTFFHELAVNNRAMKSSTLAPNEVLAVACPTCGAGTLEQCEVNGGG